MKRIHDISELNINQEALERIKCEIGKKITVASYRLFGSYARGQADQESDVDILVLTKNSLSHRERREITNIVFEVNLACDTNFSATSVDIDSWNNGFVSVLPIHDEVERDGIPV